MLLIKIYVVERSSVFRPRGPLTWLDPGAFGTLGVGGGFALGAKLCRPESEVWVIYGDGSLGYSVAEFDTFTRHKVNQKMISIMITCFSYLENGKSQENLCPEICINLF